MILIYLIKTLIGFIPSDWHPQEMRRRSEMYSRSVIESYFVSIQVLLFILNFASLKMNVPFAAIWTITSSRNERS